MKRKYGIILLALLLAVAMIIAVAHLIAPESVLGNAMHSGKISKMADYLYDKYGYRVTVADCVYFRKQDYSYHDAFLYGTTYDIPNIAIFEYNGKYITVTDREGFLGDDAQLEELNDLICGYFDDKLGLRPEFVEIWPISGGISYNDVLFHSYNEKLTQENIHEFMECIWSSDSDFKMIFYFRAEGDLAQQLDKITTQLYSLSQYDHLRSLRFYVTDMENLHIYYKTPGVHSQTTDQNARESDEGYIWGNYHVVNDVEHHYPISEAAVYQITEYNSFLCGGYCVLDRGYGGAFGSREIQTINQFGVVDLSDAALDDYLEDMVSYGQYRGYTILFRAGDDAAISSLSIADGDKYLWNFKWGSGPVELYAFKHGQLLELTTAYDCGYLSPEDMDQILGAHKAHFSKIHEWDYDAYMEVTENAQIQLEAYYYTHIYHVGNTKQVTVKVQVVNVGENFRYIGTAQDNFSKGELSNESLTEPIEETFSCVVYHDEKERALLSSDSIVYTFSFELPENHPSGSYTLTFAVFGIEFSIENVLENKC